MLSPAGLGPMLRSLFRQDRPASLGRRAVSLPTLASLALALGFLGFLVFRFDVDLAATWETVKNANVGLLALAALIHYTSFLWRGARWKILLQNAHGAETRRPGVWHCSELVLLGWFANSIGWLRMGDAYRAYLYHHDREASFSRTAGTIVSERMLDTILVVALLAGAMLFLAASGSQVSWTVLVVAVGLLAVLGLGLLAITQLVRIGSRLPARLNDWLRQFQEGIWKSWGEMPRVTALGLLGWLAETCRLYLVVMALGLDLDLALIVFITLANSLLTLAPTPGGVGAVESGVGGLLMRLSTLTASGAAALILVDRAISYLSVILTGSLLFLVRPAYRRPASETVAQTTASPSEESKESQARE